MAVGAHQDDVEIMAFDGILQCFGRKDKWFLSVTVTNGSGSPRTGVYADFTDEQMMEVRRQEQKKAAVVGEYAAAALLDYPSSAAKDPATRPSESHPHLLISRIGDDSDCRGIGHFERALQPLDGSVGYGIHGAELRG